MPAISRSRTTVRCSATCSPSWAGSTRRASRATCRGGARTTSSTTCRSTSSMPCCVTTRQRSAAWTRPSSRGSKTCATGRSSAPPRRPVMRGVTVASVLLPALAFAAAPYMVTDLTPGPDDGGADSLRAAGTRVVFRRFGGDLWRSDATAAGTGQLLLGATRNLTTQHDRVLFTIAAPPDEALWSTDGTSAGSAFVATVSGAESCQVLPEGTVCTTISPAVDELTPAGDLLFFRQNHFALWRSDGTTTGTLRVADFSTQVCSFGCMCCTQIGPDLDEL